MSGERLVYEDIYTSIHIERYELECRQTKLGPEEITSRVTGVTRHRACRGSLLGAVVGSIAGTVVTLVVAVE